MHTDVVVIGAGVVGASVALELARAGHAVTVVDKGGGVGFGSTSASSAIVRFNFSTRAGVAAAWESQHQWRCWSRHLGVDVGERARFEQVGLAFLDVDSMPRSATLPLFDELGVPYREWTSAELKQRIPGVSAGRYWPPSRIDDERFWHESHAELGAVYTPDAGYVTDPLLAAQNLAAAARHHGTQFRFRAAVEAIEQEHGRVAGVVLADGARIGCPVVVNAAGPWSSAVNAKAGVGADFSVRTRPLRQEVAYVPAARCPARGEGDAIMIADLDLGTYTRVESGGGLLVGGTEPECDPLAWVHDPDQVNYAPTAAVFTAHATRAAKRRPGLTVPNRPRGIVGVYDVTEDWTPIYDRSELDGFYLAIGTSGNQFKNAPVIGKFLTAIIEQTEAGIDHDTTPVQFVGEHTGVRIDLSAFSRRRRVDPGAAKSVVG
ncbi:FAD-dependent oxidoreductase [Nocardia vulneris]|uniref:NAD(P)/FAD-dependent oxidoreductase n=1 Tax=Nocardia vulneris TaxID=1141657 RepID=UPI0030D40055